MDKTVTPTSNFNWTNQTIWTGDNLDIMRGMNSASVDLIYLDPPFNSNANYAAPIGSRAAGAAFKDTWGLDDINLAWHGEIKHEHPGLYALLDATRSIHGDSMMSYLIYMAIRIMEMKRLLKPTGSIYLHCDHTASHYLKLLMDAVFGTKNFRNEVVWDYSFRLMDLTRFFNRKHDIILFYAKGPAARITMPKTPWTREEIIRTRKQKIHLNEMGEEVIWMPGGRGNSKSRLKRLSDIVAEGKAISDVWQIPVISSSAKERTGYPTQKPLALLQQIVRASSKEGDMVLDPFCGCATACIAAEVLDRQWAGIDISPKAAELVTRRMQDELGLFFRGAHRTDIPKRTDLGKVIRYNDIQNRKYLYGEQGGYCNGCETHFEMRNLQIDHIIPQARGGTDHISNLQLLCGACNALKGAKSHTELLVLLTDKGWIKRRKSA